MGTFSRLRYVIAANANALIEKAEDPEKLLRALIREMEDAGEEARLASAELLAEQQHLDRLMVQLAAEAEQWQLRAEKAVHESRDELARAAIKARAEVLARHEAASRELASVGERAGQMEQDMMTLKSKLAEAKLKLKSIHSRPVPGARPATAQSPALSPTEKRVRQALGRFDRLQTQVENLEARVRSYEVGGPAPRVWDQVTAVSDPAVEEELWRLKQRLQEPATAEATEAAA
ncbi:MAG TPA: PspA/IM30 family protein [Xanthomonadales bacterium]|nr:PspA/IM30 family protein [Xanthomonadales bacterium]